jgi:hypothetical protein
MQRELYFLMLDLYVEARTERGAIGVPMRGALLHH